MERIELSGASSGGQQRHSGRAGAIGATRSIDLSTPAIFGDQHLPYLERASHVQRGMATLVIERAREGLVMRGELGPNQG